MKQLISLSSNYNRSTNLELDFKDKNKFKNTYISFKFEIALNDILQSVLNTHSNERVRVLSGSPGLGKSTFAVFVAQILSKIHAPQDKLLFKQKASKNLNANFVKLQKTKLLPVFLNGYNDNIEQAFITSLRQALSEFKISIRANSNQGALQFYKDINIKLQQQGYAGIFVIYDEFGKYLETGVHNPTELNIQFLQNFAEYCDRSKEHQIHLLLITHLSISQYANQLPLNVQQEWEKVKGRFQESPFYDSGTDYYKMISSVFKKNISSTNPPMAKKYTNFIQAYIKHFKAPSFKDFIDKKNISSILLNTFPLHPSVLALLPYLSNELAQNERTLFTFLTTNENHSFKMFLQKKFKDQSTLLMPSDLYAYFKDLIGRDVGLGGMYKIQLMLEVALARIPTKDQVSQEILSLFALCSVIKKPKFAPLTESFLISAFHGTFTKAEIKTSLAKLTSKKILFFDKYIKQYLFHEGSPIDINEEILKLKNKTLTGKGLVQVIKRYFKADYIIPKKYNFEQGITRFYRSEFISVEELKSLDTKNSLNFYKEDGLLFYVIPFNFDELKYAQHFIKNFKKTLHVFLLPENFIECKKDIEELNAVDCLHNNKDVLSAGPLVKKELECHKNILLKSISNLLKSFTGHAQLKAHLLYPIYSNQDFYNKKISHFKDLQRALGEIFFKEYNKYVKFNLEYINRHSVSGAISIGKKTFIEALRHYNKNPKTDILKHIKGRGAEFLITKTMLKTVSFKTNKTNKTNNHYTINKSSDFYTNFYTNYKTTLIDHKNEILVKDLLNIFISPPYGLRLGIIPLFIAFSDFHLKQAINHYLDEAYVRDLDGNHYDLLMKHPHKTKIYYSQISSAQQAYLNELKNIFQTQGNSVQSVIEGFIKWRASIPESSKLSSQLSQKARKFLIHIDSATKPDKMLFETIPEAFNQASIKQSTDLKNIITDLKNIKKEIESTYRNLLLKISKDLSQFICQVEKLCFNKTSKNTKNIVPEVQRVFLKIQNYPLSNTTSNFIGRALNFDATKQKQYFLETMGDVLTGVSPRHWNSKMLNKFDFVLKKSLSEIEIYADVLNSSASGKSFVTFIDKGQNRKTSFKLDLDKQINKNLSSSLNKIKTILSRFSKIEQKELVLNLFENLIQKKIKNTSKTNHHISLGGSSDV